MDFAPFIPVLPELILAIGARLAENGGSHLMVTFAIAFGVGAGIAADVMLLGVVVTMGALAWAAVPFYGRQAPAADVPRINAPILLHFAELDTRINEGWPAYEAALKANGKTHEIFVYPGVHHGFHNDSTPRYDEAAANLAWERTIAWFRRYLA